MKKFMGNFKSLGLFTFILVPVIIVGYQNCSAVNSTDPSAQQFSIHSPIAFNSALSLGYRQGSCSPTIIEAVELFSEAFHICIPASNSCELTFLLNQSFSEDETDICNTATPEDSTSLVGSFTDGKATDFGYTANPNQMCTMQFERLVNIKARKCVNAANGCEIAYLKNSQGFTSDPMNICQ